MQMTVRLSQRVAVVGVFVLALLMRSMWPLIDGAFMHQSNADEGVYYASAAALLHGMTPYSDFTFVHPPGILIILAPFAAIGRWCGDSVGIFLAREAFLLLGCLNAALVTVVLWSRGKVAAIAGGVIYACWGVTVIAEFGVNLVNVQNTLVLLAVLMVIRWPRRMILAGALVGLTCAVKIWALPYVLIALPFVFFRFGRRAFQRFFAGLVVAPAVLTVPFVVFHPIDAFSQLVTVQFDRPPSNPDLLRRMTTFVDGTPVDGPMHLPAALLVAAVGLAMTTPTIVSFVRRRHPSQWSDAAWLGALLALQAAILLRAPSFYHHYTAFIAPAGALSLGLAMGVLARHWRPFVALIPAGALACTVAVSVADRPIRPVSHDQLASAVKGSTCVWSYRTADLAAADALTSNFENGCAFSIDPFGTALRYRHETGSYASWHALVHQQLAQADAVIPSSISNLDAANRDYVKNTFTHEQVIDGYISRVLTRVPR